MILTHVSVKQEEDGSVNMKKLHKVAKALSKASKLHKKQSNTIKKVVKALKKASKAHAGQAKALKGVINGKKRS